MSKQMRTALAALALLPAISGASPQSGDAQGARPDLLDTSYILPPEGARIPPMPPQNGGQNTVVFINGGGGTYYSGWDVDAVTNEVYLVSTPSGVANLPAFDHGEVAWETLMDCVRFQFAPFPGLTITDIDPGAVPHVEAAVGGKPTDIGGQPNWGGVATGGCAPWDSTVVFNFSEYYSDMEELCFTVAQEVGHALGMDHVLLCEDPMTYLDNCHFKWFQDQSAQCGEEFNQPRQCNCGGPTQNSVAHLRGYYGYRTDTEVPYFVVPESTQDGYAPLGGVLELDIEDDLGVWDARFYIGDQLLQEQRFGPFDFKIPLQYRAGEEYVLRVVASDRANHEIEIEIPFMVTADGNAPECWEDSDCAGDNQICHQLQCWENNTRGPLGDSCESGFDCLSNQCLTAPAGGNLCTRSCHLGCDDGFGCWEGYCWPQGQIPTGGPALPTNPADGDGDGKGCLSASHGNATWLFGAFSVLLVFFRRRG